jgi:RNA polymerase sigma factor (sigma-70 family)
MSGRAATAARLRRWRRPRARTHWEASNTAFSELYRELAPKVLRYFARRTNDGQRAFDLTAETFAKAFEKRHEFRGANHDQAAAWLWAIARNELATFMRARVVEMSALSRLELERPQPGDDELLEVERLVAVEEAQDHIGRALSTLPPDQREVVRMRFVDALSYEEIAASLGVSQDVVRARASRALRTLRRNEAVDRAVRALEA